MKQLMKRIATGILVLAMVLAMMPADAQAATKKFSFKQKNFWFNGAGNAIWYDGDISKELKGVTLKIDGKKVKILDIWVDGVTGIDIAKVKEGKHKVSIEKKGYKAFTMNLVYEAPKFSDNLVDKGNVSIDKGTGDLFIAVNPKAIGKKVTVTLNDKKIFSKVAKDSMLNGDGYVIVWYQLSKPGKYAVKVSAKGFDDYKTTIKY